GMVSGARACFRMGSMDVWSQEKRERTYLFIDGGYLRAKGKEFFSAVFQATEPIRFDFALLAKSFPCTKFFYYDCIDEQRSGEDSDTFARRKRAQEEQFESIRALPGYHVIEGTL